MFLFAPRYLTRTRGDYYTQVMTIEAMMMTMEILMMAKAMIPKTSLKTKLTSAALKLGHGTLIHLIVRNI